MYAKQTQTEVSSYEGEATGSEDEDTEERAQPSYREVLGKTGETKEQESQVNILTPRGGTLIILPTARTPQFGGTLIKLMIIPPIASACCGVHC